VRTGAAFAVVQCVGERRPYGNVLLQKGVVGPDGKDLLP
jgi:L-fucose mutarotase/ribose pyranase (RbsD/FucU family)